MRDISKKLAREIFQIGDEPGSKCRRIQFMGGEWPTTEVDQGGLVERSLAIRIDRILDENGLNK